ncbi:MAG: NADH-quinone oxidoreductase subunit NuoH [Rhodospirillaceae bacterium]|jgi:NADH-quinone oxidoreductase subunit H|nr:NADH-quinone oxidoreductase subunit NuoH [Rhodospirillaceae bacterium]MBT5564127.1 NADH-quinone oxidoreductase subunit NuoH [Rhodospirillaceae bacterium]MBT6089922.1 NADH-quinone oxidoreductase subunit NuoH [Rhodospirillaceae bacterium]MBT7449969.1 NADH-quinone oxidoreductase subunit NuoH [Rhodospirillaceae bacterium]
MAELWTSYIWPVVWIVMQILMFLVPILIAVAYLTYAERKIISAMQMRIGPNVVGWFGLLQPFADALKLLTKETVLPTGASPVVFFLAPMVTFSLAMLAWAVIPVSPGWVISDLNVGILYLFAISSLGVYGVVMAGWASNSRYAFLGAMRSAAQMVSYEVSIGFIMITVLMTAGTLNLSALVEAQSEPLFGFLPGWYFIPHLPMFVVFFISVLAETNRHPFDLPEAESELVAGFMTEYSSMSFALFFLGEYANMIMMSGMVSILFLGGWLPPYDAAPWNLIPGVVWFAAKIAFCLFIFIWVRATFPRYRYDQLMRLGWKVFLPFSLIWLALTAGFLVYFDKLPA